MTLTVLPLLFPASPYNTPLTPLARALSLMCFAFLWLILDRTISVWGFLGPSQFFWNVWSSIRGTVKNLASTRKVALEIMSESPSAKMAGHALDFTLQMLDEPWEVEEFLAGLPAFLSSKFVGQHAPDVVLRYFRRNERRLLESGSSAALDTELLPLDHEDPLHYLVHQIRRAVYLDNITCFIRHIWNIASRPSAVPKEHHNRIIETAEMLSVSFRAAYAHERGVLWKDGVDDFVALWAAIRQRRESCSLKKPNEETDNELAARLFEVLWPVAALVLPDVPTLDRALAYPLPKQTLTELIRLNNHDISNKVHNPDGEDERSEAIDTMLVGDVEVVVLPRESGEGLNGRMRHDVGRLDNSS
ncbi:hypothetical protein OF83DRAFT_1293975 [Amylostereum chailletii]|nr:hypothetical protein OF83DRAFT_1293975 [Amylostereum chailletii]